MNVILPKPAVLLFTLIQFSVRQYPRGLPTSCTTCIVFINRVQNEAQAQSLVKFTNPNPLARGVCKNAVTLHVRAVGWAWLFRYSTIPLFCILQHPPGIVYRHHLIAWNQIVLVKHTHINSGTPCMDIEVEHLAISLKQLQLQENAKLLQNHLLLST